MMIAINIVAFISALLGLYVIFASDLLKKDDARVLFAAAGLIVLLWSLSVIDSRHSANNAMLPLVFGLSTVGGMHSKGAARAIFAIVSVLILLAAVI